MHKSPSRREDLTASVDSFLDDCRKELEQAENQKSTRFEENKKIVKKDTDSVDCDFKDACYAAIFKTGQCPCELIR